MLEFMVDTESETRLEDLPPALVAPSHLHSTKRTAGRDKSKAVVALKVDPFRVGDGVVIAALLEGDSRQPGKGVRDVAILIQRGGERQCLLEGQDCSRIVPDFPG